jgi:hypothetical protein
MILGVHPTSKLKIIIDITVDNFILIPTFYYCSTPNAFASGGKRLLLSVAE